METLIVSQGDGEKSKVQEVSMDVIDQNVVVQATLILGVNDVPPPILLIVWLIGIDWVKDNSKWCYKVEDCANEYNMKWLLTTHLKKNA